MREREVIINTFWCVCKRERLVTIQFVVGCNSSWAGLPSFQVSCGPREIPDPCTCSCQHAVTLSTTRGSRKMTLRLRGVTFALGAATGLSTAVLLNRYSRYREQLRLDQQDVEANTTDNSSKGTIQLESSKYFK